VSDLLSRVTGRHDYAVEVLGGATGANYSTNYRDYQGIKVPTTRRVYAYDASGQKVPEPLLVSISVFSRTQAARA
jgi:hypothetical protein